MTEHALHYRAYSPEQKREIMERLTNLWLQYPSMRLGQLISNFGGLTIYYTEDYDLIESMERLSRMSGKYSKPL